MKKKKIGIMIDGVLRDISYKFLYYYERQFPDREIPEPPYDIFNMGKLFHFENGDEIKDFFIGNCFEIYGKTQLTYQEACIDFNIIYRELIENGYEITLYSKDVSRIIPATYFFLSDNGIMGEKVHIVKDYSEMIKGSDIIVTSHSGQLADRIKGKTYIKFNSPFNQEIKVRKKITRLLDLPRVLGIKGVIDPIVISEL
jgi:hypothetical protein